MTVMDEPVWRSKIISGGWMFGETANLEAFTDFRGDITPYPF